MLFIIRMVTTSSENSRTGKSYIAFFDLDRTMIGAVSGRALAVVAREKRMMGKADMIRALLLSIAYSLKLMDPLKVMDEMVSWIRGLSEEAFAGLCKDVFTRVLLPSLYKEVLPEIDMHRRNNGKTVILSSSLFQICRQFSDHLGMDDVVCSEIEVVDGILSGNSKGRWCFGNEKLTRMREYCEKNNNTLAEAWYYADAGSDIPVLEVVGHPVCINPDKRLIKKGVANNWKVYTWK